MPQKDDAAPASQASRTAAVEKVTRVFDGFLKIDEAVVRYTTPDGGSRTVTRQTMERGDSVAVLLVDRERRVVWMVEQLRPPTLAKGPGWMTEIPAGGLEAEESPEEAAAREVAEETGYTALALERIAAFYVSPGGTSERVLLFYAFVDGKTPDMALSARTQDEGEDVALVEADLDAFLERAKHGRIEDGKTLVAGLWLLANRRRLKV
jgi:ADP-ribose pyrophosphatase